MAQVVVGIIPTMAYAVPRPRGAWELRESVATERGPRSRTLATFRVLTPDAIDRAVERAVGDLTAQQVREAARRAGAPVADDPAIGAAATLMGELSRGARIPAPWRRMLAALAGGEIAGLSESERAAAEWADAGPTRRGAALWDLLLLADHIPTHRPGELAFPGFGGTTSA